MNKFVNNFNPAGSTGKALMIVNLIGLILAGLSNTVATATDKTTSAEDKKLLVPANIVTALTNTVLYFGLTRNLIEKFQGADGKNVSSKSVANSFLKKMQEDNTFDDQVKKYIKKTLETVEKQEKKSNPIKFFKPLEGQLTSLCKKFDIQDIEAIKDPVTSKIDINKITVNDYAKNAFEGQYRNGWGVLAAFAGAVIGCAMITPVIRNVGAKLIQKIASKNNPEIKNNPQPPYQYIKDLNRYNNIYSKYPVTMKNYMAHTSGKLKI